MAAAAILSTTCPRLKRVPSKARLRACSSAGFATTHATSSGAGARRGGSPSLAHSPRGKGGGAPRRGISYRHPPEEAAWPQDQEANTNKKNLKLFSSRYPPVATARKTPTTSAPTKAP